MSSMNSMSTKTTKKEDSMLGCSFIGDEDLSDDDDEIDSEEEDEGNERPE